LQHLRARACEQARITQRQLADAIHVPYQRINEIINGRRGITPGTALRLAKFFGLLDEYAASMGSI
jgi:addiction module HigA family antidote